jgi:molybdate transport system permease protein
VLHSVHHPAPPARGRTLRAHLLTGATALALAVVSAPLGGQESRGDLLVLAASSLVDVLPNIARVWEVEVGGARVRFSFDATSRLAPQALQAASADVFVSADREWISWLEARDAIVPGSVRSIAGNALVLVAVAGTSAPSTPREVDDVQRLALAGENVPAGRYARQALESSGVWDAVEGRVVRAGSVRSALEWVARGEVPAAVVYRTDAIAEPDVEIGFTFPEVGHDPIRYWVALLAGSDAPSRGRDFIDFLEGGRARAILANAGFETTAPQPSEPSGATTAGDPTAGNPPAGIPSVASAIRLSLIVALIATLLGLVPAVGLGWLLARVEFRGKTLLSTLVLVPLVMPPVVTGFLLLSLFGGRGLLGRGLAVLGLSIPFTVLGAALAALVVGFPLYVISIRGAFEAIDRRYEELSWTLGAPPGRTFFRVSLPLALPGIAAGAVLAFARALGEFGATVVLAGNVEGNTRTIALAVYTLLESPSGRGAIWTLVGASVLLSLLALLGFEALSRRQRARLEDRRGH